MASYRATVSSPRPATEVFDYVADFSHLVEWDPSMKESVQLDGGDPLRVGARFRVVVDASLTSSEMEYETIELERPSRVVLRGRSGSIESIDTITVTSTSDGGSELVYDAELTLDGILKLADPVLQLAFNRMGDKARDGLAEKLAGS